MDSTFELATFPVKETIKILTTLLEKITSTNDQHRSTDSSYYTCFHARSIPSISIHAYFTRILKYCPCANECLVALLVYFDRMTCPTNTSIKPVHIDSYNVHRLIITGFMISSKLYSDVFFTNTRYAKVGGLPVSELNILEVEFLRLNDFSLFVTIDELQKYGDNILKHHQQQCLAPKDITNISNEEVIARPFSRLTMHDKNHWKYNNSNHNRLSTISNTDD